MKKKYSPDQRLIEAMKRHQVKLRGDNANIYFFARISPEEATRFARVHGDNILAEVSADQEFCVLSIRDGRTDIELLEVAEEEEPSKIIVRIQGGLVESVENIPQELEVHVLDFDVEGAEPDRIEKHKDGSEFVESVWTHRGSK